MLGASSLRFPPRLMGRAPTRCERVTHCNRWCARRHPGRLQPAAPLDALALSRGEEAPGRARQRPVGSWHPRLGFLEYFVLDCRRSDGSVPPGGQGRNGIGRRVCQGERLPHRGDVRASQIRNVGRNATPHLCYGRSFEPFLLEGGSLSFGRSDGTFGSPSLDKLTARNSTSLSSSPKSVGGDGANVGPPRVGARRQMHRER